MLFIVDGASKFLINEDVVSHEVNFFSLSTAITNILKIFFKSPKCSMYDCSVGWCYNLICERTTVLCVAFEPWPSLILTS